MKYIFILLLCIFYKTGFSQKIQFRSVTDSSQIFSAQLAGNPVSFHLAYLKNVDCSLGEYFVEGFYQDKKSMKNIAITGIFDHGNLYLYHFGSLQKQKSEQFLKKISTVQTLEKKKELIAQLQPKESIIFEVKQAKYNEVEGKFIQNNKEFPATLFASNTMIYRQNDYLDLPENKHINIFDFINTSGGNQYISSTSDGNGNRILMYFKHQSNLNSCGKCGNILGEEGYRVLYFTKSWNYKSYDEYITQSCMKGINETALTKSEDQNILTYTTKKSSTHSPYTVKVDLKNAYASKSK